MLVAFASLMATAIDFINSFLRCPFLSSLIAATKYFGSSPTRFGIPGVLVMPDSPWHPVHTAAALLPACSAAGLGKTAAAPLAGLGGAGSGLGKQGATPSS